MDIEQCKKAAGYMAASFVQDGMIVGLGTGSTARYFIEKLIERTKIERLNIQVVASSVESERQAKLGRLPYVDINTLSSVDLTADGADEIDSEKRMIKGGGGALLREKIVAGMSREMIVIIDETKLVRKLGQKKLPVEIVPFGYKATLHALSQSGFTPRLRTLKDNTSPYVTDNGNYIVDLIPPIELEEPETTNRRIKEIPGVVETGLFFHLAGRILVGFSDGQVTVIP